MKSISKVPTLATDEFVLGTWSGCCRSHYQPPGEASPGLPGPRPEECQRGPGPTFGPRSTGSGSVPEPASLRTVRAGTASLWGDKVKGLFKVLIYSSIRYNHKGHKRNTLFGEGARSLFGEKAMRKYLTIGYDS